MTEESQLATARKWMTSRGFYQTDVSLKKVIAEKKVSNANVKVESFHRYH